MARPVSVSEILKDLDSVLEKTAADNMKHQGGSLKTEVMTTITPGGEPAATDAAEVALRKGNKLTRKANPEASHIHDAEGNVGHRVGGHNDTDPEQGPKGAHAKHSSEELANNLMEKIQELLAKSAASKSTDPGDGPGAAPGVAAATTQGSEKGMDAQITGKIEQGTKEASEKQAADAQLYELSKKAGEMVAENLIMNLLANAGQPTVEKQASAYVQNLEKQAAAVLQKTAMEKTAAEQMALGAYVAEQLINQERAVLAKQASHAQAVSAEEQLNKIAELVAAKIIDQKKK